MCGEWHVRSREGIAKKSTSQSGNIEWFDWLDASPCCEELTLGSTSPSVSTSVSISLSVIVISLGAIDPALLLLLPSWPPDCFFPFFFSLRSWFLDLIGPLAESLREEEGISEVVEELEAVGIRVEGMMGATLGKKQWDSGSVIVFLLRTMEGSFDRVSFKLSIRAVQGYDTAGMSRDLYIERGVKV